LTKDCAEDKVFHNSDVTAEKAIRN